MNRIFQIAAIVASVIVAMLLMRGSEAAPEPEPKETTASVDMLQFVDDKVASQECVKDVRCWSSVSKLQMFAAGAPIEHDALAVRIECYKQFLQSVWEQAAEGQTEPISSDRLIAILGQKFPESKPPWSEFSFSIDQQQMVLNELIQDYSDTIESWRIIQSWLLGKLGSDGKLDVSVPFSDAALEAFQKFLVGFDIALLRHARDVAVRQKKSVVDSEAMRTAFVEADPTAEFQVGK